MAAKSSTGSRAKARILRSRGSSPILTRKKTSARTSSLVCSRKGWPSLARSQISSTPSVKITNCTDTELMFSFQPHQPEKRYHPCNPVDRSKMCRNSRPRPGFPLMGGKAIVEIRISYVILIANGYRFQNRRPYLQMPLSLLQLFLGLRSIDHPQSQHFRSQS